jgi:16S rRNA C967 or C1407 C5-methylase (RsmB/RsmF family)
MEDQQVAGKRKRMNKSARAREQKRLKHLSSLDKKASSEDCAESFVMEPFDYVLVDAECSTDGSLKHVQQRAVKTGVTDAVAQNLTLTDPEQLESLVKLQKTLISSGFNLLKPGGVLLYSTCSLSTHQNENVVKWLLEKETNAFIIPVEFSSSKENPVVSGSVEGTVRFLPGVARARPSDDSSFLFGGGFFAAKIGKRHVATST